MTRTNAVRCAVIGAGSFGTCLAVLLAERGYSVRLWARDRVLAEAVNRHRRNPRYLSDHKLSESIGERAGAAACAFNLGHTYRDLPSLRDLQEAECWYRRSLELREERDRLGRGRCYGELGAVAFGRFEEAREAKRPEADLLRHLNKASGFYHQQLEYTPPDAVNELAVAHNELGGIYGTAGDTDRAVAYFHEAIRHRETQGNVYDASSTRLNVAVALAQSGRLHDALEYARAALRGYESFGQRAAGKIQRTRQLIGTIEKEL